MKRILRNLFVMSIFLLGGATLAIAQPTVRGKVTDA